jgi:hypothetical protein
VSSRGEIGSVLASHGGLAGTEGTMLSEREHDALVQWYSQPEILEEARRLIKAKEWEQLEEHLHMRCLFTLSRHVELPPFMRDDDGGPLFPSNLNPGNDLKKWQDAIEVAWEVVEKEFDLTHDEIHRTIAEEQKADWESFLNRAEERRKAKNR